MVDKQTKAIIQSTVDTTIDKINSVALIDKMKAIKDETYKNTEQLLYNYKILKEHVEDEDGYFAMIYKNKSGSIISYSKNKVAYNEEEVISSRARSFDRSKNDLERLEKAIAKVNQKKEFKVIELKYFQKKLTGDTYNFEEIAELLSQIDGYPNSLSEKTVRRWRSSLVKEISIHLFGSDAI